MTPSMRQSKFFMPQLVMEMYWTERPDVKTSLILLNQWCEKSLLSSFRIYKFFVYKSCSRRWIKASEFICVEERSKSFRVQLRSEGSVKYAWGESGFDDKFNYDRLCLDIKETKGTSDFSVSRLLPRDNIFKGQLLVFFPNPALILSIHSSVMFRFSILSTPMYSFNSKNFSR